MCSILQSKEFLLHSRDIFHRGNEVLVDEAKQDVCCLLKRLYRTPDQIVQVVLDIGLQQGLGKVSGAHEQCFGHLLEHLELKGFQLATHIFQLIIHLGIKTDGLLLHTLNQHAENSRSTDRPVHCFPHDSTQGDESFTSTRQLLLTNRFKHVHHTAMEILLVNVFTE